MKLEAGDIVLLPFPHTNLKAGKKRPALVLTGLEYNGNSMDVVLAFVTSQRQSGEWSVGVTNDDLDHGALVKPSWVRVDRLATVEQRLVQGIVGRLKPNVFGVVRGKLSNLLM